VECDALEQVSEAIDAGADLILLDNMAPDELKRAVILARGRALLEASGSITAATVRAVAEAGVDYISAGAITHSAPNLDVGVDF
ncbi:MAG: nicotinate-nucleotide diphosphorylase, partial [Rhizomicrobium sp.]